VLPDNVESAIIDYIAEDDNREGYMPSVAELKENGYFGLAKAVESFGGMSIVAQELGLKVRTKRGGKGRWHDHVTEVARKTGLSRADGLFEVASKTYKLPKEEARKILNEKARSPNERGGPTASQTPNRSNENENSNGGKVIPEQRKDSFAGAFENSAVPKSTRKQYSRSEIDGW